MREFSPHLVMVHRPNDYHPDHRYTSQLVQDASYMLTVPNVVARVPHLPHMLVIAYTWDRFQKPIPFQPDVVISIDHVIEQKVDALHCHVSQMYEWLPYNGGYLQEVPADAGERRAWLRQRLDGRFRRIADLYRDILIHLYGEERGRQVQYAEAFEGCEYSASLAAENMKTFFPFLP
jgi:LmbE family N-acetylglucosaminyl deacetylase